MVQGIQVPITGTISPLKYVFRSEKEDSIIPGPVRRCDGLLGFSRDIWDSCPDVTVLCLLQVTVSNGRLWGFELSPLSERELYFVEKSFSSDIGIYYGYILRQ